MIKKLSCRRWVLVVYHYASYVKSMHELLLLTNDSAMIRTEMLNMQILNASVLYPARFKTSEPVSLY